ncbi:GNAT family N-acetyltransferase [Pseudomonas sp. PDM15]|uniref:GNAT family N-acetyltransferase n=1 Tax=Pseudomonas sp. PDM15 TaxID=2769303 RepID=UPI0017813F45|nr:GNAT family N-acetyltransferase [Pseudomonas sp. PDM15]MBD9423837.1 GNAT family N-acetyltransferase [Pseudomonas sp. PDM15]
MKIDWLRDHPVHCDTVAAWLHRQFPYEFAEQPLAAWQAEFRAGQGNGDWRMLIALQEGEVLGCAGLARDDLPQRPELGPWLACVYVLPEMRGQGMAERLIESIYVAARERGYHCLYLHTHDRADYYAKRGWQWLERFQAWGGEHQLMVRQL